MNHEIQSPSGALLDVPSLCKRSWALFAAKPFEHVVAAVLVMVLSTLTLGILSGPLFVGYLRMTERQQRGEAIGVPDVFSGFSSFGSALLATLVLAVCACIGLSLLVLPGLFVLAAWGFAFHFIAVEDASLTASLAGSWQLLKQQTASVLVVLLLVMLVNAVAGGVLFGLLLSLPLTLIFGLYAFQDLRQRSEAAPPLAQV